MILTDRSRYERGTKTCQRARYWEYEYQGTGIQSKSESLPLATGIHVHEALARMLMHLLGYDEIPERWSVRALMKEITEKYREECKERDFQEEDTSEQRQYVIGEQACLIEGLAWAFYRCVLPWLHQEFEVVAVEEEIEYPAGCTCSVGSGVGSFSDHDAQKCEGVGIMIRPDMILRRRSDGQLVVGDFKTSAYPGEIKDGDHLVQMVLAGIGAEKAQGEPVTAHYLFGLYKGKREADRGEKLKRQRSSVCYLYWEPADPPYGAEVYQAEYTRAKGFGRVPVWECFSAERGDASAVEYWVLDRMTAEECGALVGINGPLQRQSYLDQDIITEQVTEALDVRQRRVMLEIGELRLEEAFRRSWDCHEYGRPCEFLCLCLKQPGHEEPLLSGRFKVREPHHEAEKVNHEEG